jgi:transposase
MMDNSSIYTPAKVRDLVESRGYERLYLMPYSPFFIQLKNSDQNKRQY